MCLMVEPGWNAEGIMHFLYFSVPNYAHSEGNSDATGFHLDTCIILDEIMSPRSRERDYIPPKDIRCR